MTQGGNQGLGQSIQCGAERLSAVCRLHRLRNLRPLCRWACLFSIIAVMCIAAPGRARGYVLERVSVDSNGNQAPTVPGMPDGVGYTPSISADGRYVAFSSDSPNLVPGDTNTCGDGDYAIPGSCPDVFVHDRQTGITERVSVDSAGNQASGGRYGSGVASISADGRYVAFVSGAPNLVAGDANGVDDVFVHDRLTGVTERVSVDSAGNEGNGWSGGASLSADGHYVAFTSGATNLVPGTTCTGGRQFCENVFVRDREAGVTEIVSVDSNLPSISADGRLVAFTSRATNLVPGDTNGKADVFVHDRLTGITERVSVDSAGNQSAYWNPDKWSIESAAISADGRYVAFSSDAGNLVPNDTNGMRDVFVHDRQTGVTERVSVDSAGNQGTGNPLDDLGSGTPAMSADGRYVAFTSNETNLVAGNNSLCPGAIRDGTETLANCLQLFVHDRVTGLTERVSQDDQGAPGRSWSWDAAISGDGRYVAFSSDASNLVPRDTNGYTDVFVASDCRSATCGDGVVQLGCEQCDDGNLVDGDGCSAQCTMELIPGGNLQKTDCAHEWWSFPTQVRRGGVPAAKVTCTDDDPTCDFGASGDQACTFHVAMCFNVTDRRIGCSRTDVQQVQLIQPGMHSSNATNVAMRTALEGSLVGLGGAVQDLRSRRAAVFSPALNVADQCTAFADITVPLRGGGGARGTKTLLLRATPSNDPDTGRRRASNMDRLTLTCQPRR